MDDLALAESEEKLLEMIRQWKDGMKQKGLRINMGKTKVMKCEVRQGQAENLGKFPCGICRKDVARNSICDAKCKKWIHKMCIGIRNRLELAVGFQCTNCTQGAVVNAVVQELCPIQVNGDTLECVDKFCYFGDMIGSGDGAEVASRMRVKCAWGKFRELSHILTARRASLKLKGKVYRTCVQSVMVYGGETWAMKAEDMQRLERTERKDDDQMDVWCETE